jgi:hypothetical protein
MSKNKKQMAWGQVQQGLTLVVIPVLAGIAGIWLFW